MCIYLLLPLLLLHPALSIRVRLGNVGQLARHSLGLGRLLISIRGVGTVGVLEGAGLCTAFRDGRKIDSAD